jgi:voltage-gated potassium channel
MDERSARLAKRFEVPMLIAAVLVIPVIAIEQSDASDAWRTLATTLNWLIWVAFATEAVVMLAVVPSKARWVRLHPLEVVIVLFTAPFLPASLQAARVFRLVRLLRLFRLAPLARRVFSLEGLRYAALLAGLTVLGGGAAFAAVEQGRSTWDGVWWAITTMTTVGYGGSPETQWGRAITIVLLIVGIGFVAVLTGAVAERFLESKIEDVTEATEEIEATEESLLAELRAIRTRLDRIESGITSAS